MTATVIFDLDGTLADTSGDLLAAANAVFEARGEGSPLDPEGDAAVAFRGGRAMLALGYERVGPAAAPDADFHVLLDHYGANIDRFTRLYPGAIEAVTALARRGYAVAICTNKPEALAETLLVRLGVRDAFGAVIGADTLPVRKPDPEPLREAVRRAGGDPRRALIVGDTETDVATARAAGVPVVLVGFGPEGADVARLAPDRLIDCFSELPDAVAALLGPA